MRRALAVAVSVLLLAWGAYCFQAQVSQVAPVTGVEWVDSSRGVVADDVIPRLPAWRGGLRPGDHLRAHGGGHDLAAGPSQQPDPEVGLQGGERPRHRGL